MTVRVNKPAFNLREKLSELTSKFGLKGTELARAETVQDARDLISAGRKNIIINGANEVDQRGSGSAAITTLNNGLYVTDRWIVRAESNTTGQASQSSVAPDDFTNSLLVEVGATAVPRIASDNRFIRQNVEGYNLRPLKWGTANAKPATISFWVRSSLTGTYSFSFFSGLVDQHYVTNYTISVADTWEYKTITVPGPTSGTFRTGNELAVYVHWDLGSGSNHQTSALNNWYSGDSRTSTTGVDFFNTANANFRLTGVQLEAGTNATDFEYRSYAEELALCYRYFYRKKTFNAKAVWFFSTSGGSCQIDFPTEMRANPTFSYNGVLASDINVYYGPIANYVTFTAFGASIVSGQSSRLNVQGITPAVTAGYAGGLYMNTSAYLDWSAEL